MDAPTSTSTTSTSTTSTSTGAPRLDELPLPQRRPAFEALMTGLPVPDDVTATPTTLGGVPAYDVVLAGSGDATVLHLHGGAYVMGSARAAVRTAALLARQAGARAVALDYRLAPEHPHPAALEDALAGYRALLDSGVAAERLVLTGESAGGGLVLATLVAAVRAGLPVPAAAVVLSPWTDLTLSGASYVARQGLDPVLRTASIARDAIAYAADRRADPLVSPLLADLRGLPPLLVQVGSAEILLDDATQLAARAAEADVPVQLEVYPGATHVFQHGADGSGGTADEALARVGAFVRRLLPGEPLQRLG
ncbi:acetyl esterase/lipase [Motilibacter rhizosphaerae]|uniref:Acetyl esterase/lipase n=1 Tax=Motilibacter rhizosphaerae TaxID=598652 RepID=A0A4Q7NUK2_9ACTN|nr:alpha/beta hydrolase [Motilibacter rhizosphaerae]RZS90896.1 acetyl esterase/lipase [Motilibacter rhizosphaerae]